MSVSIYGRKIRFCIDVLGQAGSFFNGILVRKVEKYKIPYLLTCSNGKIIVVIRHACGHGHGDVFTPSFASHLMEHSYMTSDVFWGIFDLPTYPHQILYYISLFSKIRLDLTYLPTQKSDVIYECSLNQISKTFHICKWISFAICTEIVKA